MALTPKNWSSFQHYKDRAPPWIKLHRGLLDNIDYYRLSAEAGKALPLIWLIASEKDGLVPSAPELAFRLRIDEDMATDILDELVERCFLVESDLAETAEQDATPAQRVAKSNGFGSRHISDEVKRVVWERDGGKCCECGGDQNIEFDHKHPVSKGGNSEEGNVQLLCRRCNRRKRARVATQQLGRRSLEAEDIEKKKEEHSSASRPGNEDFENLKRAYPRRKGNYGWKAAERKFNSLVKTGVDPKVIIAAAVRLGEVLRPKVGTEFIPMPASWLNSEDFIESAIASFDEAPAPIDWDSIVRTWTKTGYWSHQAGPDPESPACRCPRHIIEKHSSEARQ